MSAQTVYLMGMGMYSPTNVGIPMVEDSQGMTELPRHELSAPQLVMLANVAVTSESNGCENMAEEKEMMELKTVGTSCYSDSEDESVIRYSYENHREICIVDYPESPAAAETRSDICIVDYPESPAAAMAQLEIRVDDIEEEEGGEEEEEVIEDLSKPAHQQPSSPITLGKRKSNEDMGVKSAKKKKPFHCKACNYQAMCEEEFVQHIRIHSANKMVVVRRVEGVDKPNEAVTGLEFEPTVDVGEIKGVIRCERCGYNTNRYDHYIAHLKHHSKEGDNHRVYKCVICTYTTVSQYHWRKHLRNHFPSKLFTCSHCCYFSDRKNNYVQHIRTHTGERPFQCLQCEYSSSQKTHLTRHMRTHSGERPFKCDSCTYLAANQHEVTRHARQVHNGPKPLACPYCQYKTADRSNFKKHVELHLNPRQFLCPVCKYAASKKCNLQYHIKSRHPGCNIVNMDVSKVKLRAKKLESETDELEKLKLSGMENEQDIEEDNPPELTDADKQSTPMNLSTKSSKPNLVEAVKSGTFDKTHKKCETTPNKEKPKKAKDKLEKKVTPKQKKTENGSENTKLNKKTKQSLTKTVAAVESADGIKKSQKRQKKDKVKKASLEMDTVVKDSLENNPQKEMSEVIDVGRRDEREKEGQLKKLNIERLGKESNNTESEKSGCSKIVKVAETIVSESPESKEVPVKNQGAKTKAKARKRKATEALDLSTKVSPEEPCTSKGKRLKVKSTEKQQSKSSNPQRVPKNTEPGLVSVKKSQANEMMDLPAVIKAKKTKKKNKKETVTTCENKCTMTENFISSKKCPRKKCPSTEIQQSSDQKTILTLDSKGSATEKQLNLAEQEGPKQLNLAEQEGPKQLNLAEQEGPKQLNRAEQEGPKQLNLAEQEGPKQLNLAEQEGPKQLNLAEQEGPKQLNLGEQEGPKQLNLAEQERPKQLNLAEQEGPKQLILAEQEGPKELGLIEQEAPTAKETPSMLEKADVSDKTVETTGISSNCGNETPSPTEGGSSPIFRRPQAKPTSPSLELPRPRDKPTDTEEDEGIHSHDGGSDISDSASEGSDDSGLNGLPASADGAGKMADPETPTDEMPTPTELKSHMCIFCDRTFPLEVEYRRHLNRHLVNVYYLDNASEADQ